MAGSEPIAAGDATGTAASAEPSVAAARFAIVADDPDETGPERDERIDRLVVSRLRRSALSVAEVRAVLAEHGLDEAEIEEWIERYERLGYLDDARLAEQLVHVNGARRGRGQRRDPAGARAVGASTPRHRATRRRTNSTPRSSAATPSTSPNGEPASSPGSTGRPPSGDSPRSCSGAGYPGERRRARR